MGVLNETCLDHHSLLKIMVSWLCRVLTCKLFLNAMNQVERGGYISLATRYVQIFLFSATTLQMAFIGSQLFGFN